MNAVLVKAIKDLRRRRLQAIVVFVTALLAVAAGTMALTLMLQTRDPYMAAFDAQRGAHLRVTYDIRTDRDLLARTPALIRAQESSGPYTAADIQFQFRGHKSWVTAIGRDSADAKVGVLRLTKGRWPANDHEIVLTHSFADLNHISIGDTLRVTSISPGPLLTVVGAAVDIEEVSASIAGQHAWMLPSAIPALSLPHRTGYLMDYRYASDPSRAQLQAAVSTLRGALPAGSIAVSVNYLDIRTAFNVSNQISTGILMGFSVFALLATVAIVANLVTGIVISSYREIGIMKALGFTPGQVEAVLLLQTLIPAAAAAVVAMPIGTVASQPVLASGAQSLGLAYEPVYSPVPALLALVGAVLITTAAAFLPALRAGRLRPTAIIASASAPRGRNGRWLRGLATRLGLPRPVALGAGEAFARPLRAIFTVLAVFIALATVVVAVGAPRSFARIYDIEGSARSDVIVERSPAFADADAMRIISSDPQTAAVVGVFTQTVAVPGIGDPVPTQMFRGDPGRLGLQLIRGRWFDGPGEVVAPAATIRDAHLNLGDRFTIAVGSKPVELTLVGEIYDVANLGYSMFLDLSTVSAIEPDAAPPTYYVFLAPGSDADAYVRRLAAAQPDLLDVQKNPSSYSSPLGVLNLVLYALSAVIIIIGVAAIFNTLLLNIRERVRDTATLKALGMSPGQVVVMISASAGLLALVGAIFAVPAGYGLNVLLMMFIDSGIGGNSTPPFLYQVFSAWELVFVAVAGVALAVAAALVPGRWAARTNVIEALHTE